jgi:hypothetical protein
MEIRAMKQLKQSIFAAFPYTKSLILPTRFVELSDIRPNREITEKYSRLVELFPQFPLGSQYEWLARFAAEYRLTDLELCVEKAENTRAHRVLGNNLILIEEAGESFYRLAEDCSNPDLHIFDYFKFPLFNVSKMDMESQAIKFGFADIMEQTWFCHNPRRDGSTCGHCLPCQFAREGGLGRRVRSPAFSSVIKDYLIRHLPAPVKGLLRKHVLPHWRRR